MIWGTVAVLGIVIAVFLVPVGRRTPMKVTDPVCGMTFDGKKAVATVEYQGRTYYFCAQACRKQFEEDPARYV